MQELCEPGHRRIAIFPLGTVTMGDDPEDAFPVDASFQPIEDKLLLFLRKARAVPDIE